EYDAARQNWGGSWRMPTKQELRELARHCEWTWTTEGGHYGYRVTERTERKNSIFLPAAGYYEGTSLDEVGACGYYWSSSLRTSNSGFAYSLYFGRGYDVPEGIRYDGRSVRPVRE
ncbi:MAG: hypothetical protein Q4E55_07735, partial [Bacteroidales bacterium]|nr:hypothetical protein [Bacteroidales bacterium]